MRLSVLATILLSVPAMASALPEATPARALSGRVAGAPRMCVPALAADTATQLFTSGDILYRGRGGTIYLNHPQGCPSLTPHRAITSRTSQDQLCHGDIVSVVDPQTGILYGSCPLGDFVPYDRPGK